MYHVRTINGEADDKKGVIKQTRNSVDADKPGPRV